MLRRVFCAALCALLLFCVPAAALAIVGCPTPFSDADNILSELKQAWKPTLQSGQKYPDDIAGLYVSDDQKPVVVLVNGATEARKNELRALVSKPDALVFKSARYSYNELYGLMSQITTDGSFELVYYGVRETETVNALVVGVYYGDGNAARAYFSKFGDRVKVEEVDRNYALTQAPDPADINENFLRTAFPKLRSVVSETTRFVFNTAPESTKTRAVLDKKGTTLTLYRFENKNDFDKARALIAGAAVVSGSKTVYADTPFPVTWYYHSDKNTLALYCGADAKVHSKLLKEGYRIAGEYGGYFQARDSIDVNGAIWIDGGNGAVKSLKALRAVAKGVYLCTVARAPQWDSANVPAGSLPNIKGTYELNVTRVVRGSAVTALRIYDWPQVMRPGRTYVVFISYAPGADGKARPVLADKMNRPAFEVDDRGYVLPLREYGMKAPVKLETFLRGIR